MIATFCTPVCILNINNGEYRAYTYYLQEIKYTGPVPETTRSDKQVKKSR